MRGRNAGNFKSSRGSPTIDQRAVRSRSPGICMTSLEPMPNSRSSRSMTYGSMVCSTSRRTGGPKRRRISSRSSASSRFSASSSSTSRSSFRVTRKMWCCRTSMPGKSSSRCAAMRSSSGTNRDEPTGTRRSRIGGTFTLAKSSLSVVGFFTTTARLSESPLMYGNGCAGSTAKGVRTGKTLSRKNWPKF